MYFGNFLGVMEIQGGDYTLNCTFKSTYFTVYEVYLEKKISMFYLYYDSIKKKKGKQNPGHTEMKGKTRTYFRIEGKAGF